MRFLWNMLWHFKLLSVRLVRGSPVASEPPNWTDVLGKTEYTCTGTQHGRTPLFQPFGSFAGTPITESQFVDRPYVLRDMGMIVPTGFKRLLKNYVA